MTRSSERLLAGLTALANSRLCSEPFPAVNSQVFVGAAIKTKSTGWAWVVDFSRPAGGNSSLLLPLPSFESSETWRQEKMKAWTCVQHINLLVLHQETREAWSDKQEVSIMGARGPDLL